MTTNKMTLYRALGGLVVSFTTVLSIVLGAKYPVIIPITSGINWYIGKILGIPLPEITMQALSNMPPKLKTEAVIQSLAKDDMPVKDKQAMAITIVNSLPPPEAERIKEIVRSIYPDVNSDVQRALLERAASERK